MNTNEFKVGDRVVLDDAYNGFGANPATVNVDNAEGQYEEQVIGDIRSPYACSACSCSFEGCPECLHDGIKERKVEVGYGGPLVIMYGFGDLWVPNFAYTGEFKLDDGRILKVPEPQGSGWCKISVDSIEKTFVHTLRCEKGLYTLCLMNPWGSGSFQILHQEGFIWAYDMARILVENKAQLINLSIWHYTKPQESVEEPYIYPCASRQELQGKWPKTGRPHNILGDLRFNQQEGV